MKKHYIYPALIVVLIMCSCGNQSETPVQVAERMQVFACAGDVEGFYAYVDKLSVENNLKNIATQKIRENIANTDDLKEFEEVVIPSRVDEGNVFPLRLVCSAPLKCVNNEVDSTSGPKENHWRLARRKERKPNFLGHLSLSGTRD